MKLRGAASKLRRGTLKLRGRGTWLGAGAVALAVPAMFFSRRFARLLFEHHDDALIALQWMPGVGVLLGSLASRRKSGPPPPLYESESMRVVRDAVAKVAPTGATVVLRGETGVGKELVARDVHDSSLRRTRPFVKINCAALPSDCSKPSCSVTSAAPSPAPRRASAGASSTPTAARCSSTRWAS